MSSILIQCSNDQSASEFENLYKKRKELFINKIFKRAYLMEDNGEAIMYILKFKDIYPDQIILHKCSFFDSNNISDKIKRAVEWLKKNNNYPEKKEVLKSNNLPSLEELRQINLVYSENSKERFWEF